MEDEAPQEFRETRLHKIQVQAPFSRFVLTPLGNFS